MTVAFEDVRRVLDQALEAGGGKVICPDYPQAVRWRQRAYTLRKKLQALAKEQYGGTSLEGRTPYDQMVLYLRKGERVVHVRFEQVSVEFEPLSEDARQAVPGT